MRDPERAPERPREHTNPDQPERLQPEQHLFGQPAADHPFLHGVAVDEPWGIESAESRHADRVPRTATDSTEIGLPRTDVPDQSTFERDLTVSPGVPHI